MQSLILCRWPFMLNWAWTAQVFFTLHILTILMKMHSYAFYNGHLSETERRLWALDNPETASTAAAVKYPSSSTTLNEIDQEKEDQKHQDEADALTHLREDLALELTSPLGHVTYPQNLTLGNYVDYVLCPTLCYELEYPRTPKTQWMELFWKVLAVFGCIFLLMITSEEFIVPVLNESALRLEGAENVSEMGLILAESISMLLFPFMVTLLLVFLVIFEYVLGAFAEITCFADRHFYSDWWNSCDWHVVPLFSPCNSTTDMLQARVLPRMEYTSPPFPAAACLRGLSPTILAPCRHSNHLSHQRYWARASHGLHHQKAKRVWLSCTDDAAADCNVTTNQVRSRPEGVQQHLLLGFHDTWSIYGERCAVSRPVKLK